MKVVHKDVEQKHSQRGQDSAIEAFNGSSDTKELGKYRGASLRRRSIQISSFDTPNTEDAHAVWDDCWRLYQRQRRVPDNHLRKRDFKGSGDDATKFLCETTRIFQRR
jgi:hypothetical protein